MWLLAYAGRLRRDRLGVVADYCAICRDVRPFSLFHAYQTYHLHILRGVPGPWEQHEIQCEECSTVFRTDPSCYSTYRGEGMDDVEVLGDTTHPGMLEKYHRELTAVRRAREKRLTREQRWALLIEPFLSLPAELNAYDSFFCWWRKVHWIFLEIICLSVLLLIISEWTDLSDHILKRVALIGIPGLAITSWFGFRVLRTRHVVRKVLPRIGRSLACMEPAFGELAQLLEYCHAKDNPIVKCTSLERLWRLIQNPGKIRGRAYCYRVNLDELGVQGTLLSRWLETPRHAGAG
jgi:hypothetical protein